MNLSRLRSSIRNAVPALGVATLGFAMTAQNAIAGDLADAVTAEITTAKPEIMLVAVAVLGLTGVILLIKYVRRAVH
jgi:hypothetical protein